MSLKILALKIGELRPLSRSGLLLLGARCVIRAEPWIPPGGKKLWTNALTGVVNAAFAPPRALKDVKRLMASISDLGATACNRLQATDEPLGRCMSYATATLGSAIEATTLDLGAPLKKMTIMTAKFSASIPAILAHAGRVKVPRGQDAVDFTCTQIWDAIRADIPPVAAASESLERAPDRLRALRKL